MTAWSKKLDRKERRFVVCTGGGPGIMEAANRGASEAKGLNVGLTISIPDEEFDNPYVSPRLHFYFHYFFMRKFWFVYLAKAVVLFPGGYGTLDELFEILTLVQTRKTRKRMPIVLFGAEYWDEVINFDALVKYGTISPGDLAFSTAPIRSTRPTTSSPKASPKTPSAAPDRHSSVAPMRGTRRHAVQAGRSRYRIAPRGHKLAMAYQPFGSRLPATRRATAGRSASRLPLISIACPRPTRPRSGG